MLTLLHISDLHFGPPFVPEVGEALLEDAARLTPDAIVITGDFTQRARPQQFAQAREYLQRLPAVPKVVMPGNHDVPLYRVWERLNQPYDLYREYISPELDTVTRVNDAVIVALNSCAPHRAISNGRISREQLEFCERAFAAAPADAVRIVAAHHHFAPAPDYEGGEVMPKAKRALDVFARLRVDLIMAGHLHRAYVGNSLDVYSGEDREHGILIVQCGTSTSRRGRAREQEKNSYNWLTITDDTIHVLHYMYFHDIPGFSPVARYEFPRPGKRLLNGVEGAP
ncbi:MAG: metallophosphoesterase [Pseudomonadota bacterium]|nr:metallophosphoesterase [Pseudomonadota bacterium]